MYIKYETNYWIKICKWTGEKWVMTAMRHDRFHEVWLHPDRHPKFNFRFTKDMIKDLDLFRDSDENHSHRWERGMAIIMNKITEEEAHMILFSLV